MSGLPVLLPASAIPQPTPTPHLEWKPKRYLSEPQPPPQDEGKLLEQELANQRQMIDGKIIKKTRPRRTVDYNGGIGRWALVCITVNWPTSHLTSLSFANCAPILFMCLT